MKNFTEDLVLKHSYTSIGMERITNDFLIPTLKCATAYRRSVGFFSSSVLSSIIDGIVALSRNKGKIQIIASPKLSEDDIIAITAGYEHRKNVIEAAFTHDFEEALTDYDDEMLNLLALLVARGTLDIKIAVTSTTGMYHDKFGILEDYYGNVIAFFGSPNSSYNGYENNYEKIRVVRSWIPGEADSVQDEVDEFNSLWAGTNPVVETYEFQEGAKRSILQTIENRNATAANGEKAPIVLRDYQEEAIRAWVDNGFRGFYVMATGTGKTWTAIFSAKRLISEHPSMIIICAPYKHLVKQWEEDVRKIFDDATIIMVSSENPGWENRINDAIVAERQSYCSQIVIISTITSFYLDRFQKIIDKSKQEKLLIVDEAHRFTKRPDTLQYKFRYLLGLSATPYNGKDLEKALRLTAFFGGKVFDLPIEKALERGFLVKYNYYPIIVNATGEEEHQFRIKSSQMAGCFKNGVCINPEAFARYYRARLRIIAMAEEKLSDFDSILDTVKEDNHLIVYCGDGRLYDTRYDGIRHIQFVKQGLSRHGYKASQFTATENMQTRMDLVESFNAGEIDALAAIRCLDEGINIPSITGALILASNDDYREFVQRRGRILRIYGDKQFANIYDIIVLPSWETPKMAEIELRRFYEYARLAINKEQLLEQLSSLATSYNLEIEDFVTSFDEVGEAELDE